MTPGVEIGARPSWGVRYPLVLLCLPFLAGLLAGGWGGRPAFPAAACLALSLASPTPLGFASGGFAAGALVAGRARVPARPPPAASSLPGWFAGRVLRSGRGPFGEEEAEVAVKERGEGERVRFRAILSSPSALPPCSSLISFRARLRPPRAGPKTRDRTGCWMGRIQAGGWVSLPRPPDGWGWWEGWTDGVRAFVRKEAGSMGEEGGVLAALALGETGMLGPRLSQEFRAAGTWHILAVSGVHVAATLSLALLLVRPLSFPCARTTRARAYPAAAAVAAAAGLAFYLGVVEGSSSALRAALFAAMLGAAGLAGRERSLLNAGAFCLLFLSCLGPPPQPDLSLSLSLAGCLGIAASFRKEDRWAMAAARVSAGACLFTLPLVALSLRALPLLAPPFNLVIGTWFDLVLIPLAVGGDALAGWWPSGAHALFGLWRLAALPALVLQGAAVPDWSYLPLRAPGAAVAALLGMAGCLWWWRRRGDLRVGAFLLLGIPLVAAAIDLAAARLGGGVEVVFAGAGQSDLALLRGFGRTVLLDAGPPPSWGGRSEAERLLSREGVGRVDLLVLSHPHPDHVGGALPLLEAGRVRELAIPAGGGPGPWRDVLRAAGASIRLVPLRKGQVLDLGRGGTLEVLEDGRGGTGNRASLVCLVRTGGATALFPGDAPWDSTLRSWREAGDLGLLKVPHHGSAAGGFPPGAPGKLRAGLAVFCSFPPGGRGIPAPAVLEGFHRARIPAAFTGTTGIRVGLEAPGRGFSVDIKRRFW